MVIAFLSVSELIAQTGYRDELGRSISRDYFEKQIIEGPYFGVPYDEGGKILVHRMPFGKVDDPMKFYESINELEAYEQGLSLVVIFYPGADECNSNSRDFEVSAMKKADKSLKKWAEKGEALPPIYLFENSGGLMDYVDFMDWQEDPRNVFQQEFFKYPYPCKSFVVLHPSGNYRAILGDFPWSQVDQALKKLNKAYN